MSLCFGVLHAFKLISLHTQGGSKYKNSKMLESGRWESSVTGGPVFGHHTCLSVGVYDTQLEAARVADRVTISVRGEVAATSDNLLNFEADECADAAPIRLGW